MKDDRVGSKLLPDLAHRLRGIGSFEAFDVHGLPSPPRHRGSLINNVAHLDAPDRLNIERGRNLAVREHPEAGERPLQQAPEMKAKVTRHHENRLTVQRVRLLDGVSQRLHQTLRDSWIEHARASTLNQGFREEPLAPRREHERLQAPVRLEERFHDDLRQGAPDRLGQDLRVLRRRGVIGDCFENRGEIADRNPF